MKKCTNYPDGLFISYEEASDIARTMNGCDCIKRYLDLKPDKKHLILDYSQSLRYEHECPERKCSKCFKTSPVQKPIDANIKLYCPFCGERE
jgi:hypothetical protein